MARRSVAARASKQKPSVSLNPLTAVAGLVTSAHGWSVRAPDLAVGHGGIVLCDERPRGRSVPPLEAVGRPAFGSCSSADLLQRDGEVFVGKREQCSTHLVVGDQPICNWLNPPL